MFKVYSAGLQILRSGVNLEPVASASIFLAVVLPESALVNLEPVVLLALAFLGVAFLVVAFFAMIFLFIRKRSFVIPDKSGNNFDKSGIKIFIYSLSENNKVSFLSYCSDLKQIDSSIVRYHAIDGKIILRFSKLNNDGHYLVSAELKTITLKNQHNITKQLKEVFFENVKVGLNAG